MLVYLTAYLKGIPKKCLAPMATAIVLALLSGCGSPQTAAETATSDTETNSEQPADEPPALVKLATATVVDQASIQWHTGTLISRNDARLAAEVAGPLVRVAEVGDRLEKGDVVAQVDDRSLRLRLRADQAELARLEAQAVYIDQQLARLERLTAEEVTARQQLDELIAQRAMIEQQLEGARVTLDTTRFYVERSIVRAPFTGRLVERMAHPGSYVTVGEDIARLVDIERAEIQVRAPLSAAAAVEPGLTVKLEGPGGETFDGTVRAAVPVGDDRSRMFEVRVDVPAGRWNIGAPIKVALPQSTRRRADSASIAVPRDALVLRQGVSYLFVVDADGHAHRLDVTTGAGHGDLIEVRPVSAEYEIAVGSRVVIRGAESLDDGRLVVERLP